MKEFRRFFLCLVMLLALAPSHALGSAPQSLTADAIDWGRLAPGTHPAVPRDVTVTNNTNKTLSIERAEFVNPQSVFTFTASQLSIGRGKMEIIGGVMPRANLQEGRYSDTLTLYGAGDTVLGTVELRLEVSAQNRITVSVPTFADQQPGYRAPAAQAITITNAGLDKQVISEVLLEGGGSGSFTLSGGLPSALPKNERNTTWFVAPKEGLAAGTYTANVVVVAENNGVRNRVSQPVTFSVGASGMNAPVIKAVDGTASGGGMDAGYSPKFPQQQQGATADFIESIRYPVPMDRYRSAHEETRTRGIQSYANIRSGPGTRHDIIGAAYPEETIWLVEWNEDESWCLVYHEDGNQIGWLSRDFIQMPAP